MFNNDEPPVSLFSFQDIITSLTGIMIFFLLLLALNILELRQNSEEGSPAYGELKQVQEENKVLKKQIEDISADIRTYRKRIRTAQTKDEADLTIERYRLEKQIKEAKSRQKDLEKQLKEAAERYNRLVKENEQLKKQKQELDRAEKKCRNLTAQIEKKKKEIAEIRKAIEKRRKEVQVTIDASIDKIPVLVDLSAESVVVVDTRTKAKKVISRKSPILTELASDAIAHLQTFAPGKYYFVLMVKPSAAEYLVFFLNTMQSRIKNASYGMEPILESEGVTNEQE